MEGRHQRTRTVDVLEADPDLAASLSDEARPVAPAYVQRLEPGSWEPGQAAPETDGFGLLLISGFVVRRVGREAQFGAEILGPGDLLRPWQAPGRLGSRRFESGWQVLTRADLAILDAEFVVRVAPFPEIAVRLVDRAMLRSRHLALELAAIRRPASSSGCGLSSGSSRIAGAG
jgi:hypothetical protein